MTDDWIQVATLADFGGERRLLCEVDGVSVLLYRLNAGIVAVRNACTHLGQPLAGGRVIAGQIHCPFHGACFDLATGAAISGPAVAPLRCYQVRVEGDAVLIQRS